MKNKQRTTDDTDNTDEEKALSDPLLSVPSVPSVVNLWMLADQESPEPDPRPAGRLVEQHREQVPLGVSQQEQAG